MNFRHNFKSFMTIFNKMLTILYNMNIIYCQNKNNFKFNRKLINKISITSKIKEKEKMLK